MGFTWAESLLGQGVNDFALTNTPILQHYLQSEIVISVHVSYITKFLTVILSIGLAYQEHLNILK
jgi:hypothetical protein